MHSPLNVKKGVYEETATRAKFSLLTLNLSQSVSDWPAGTAHTALLLGNMQ
jgi:hypothetical protein